MGKWTLFSNHGHVLVCLARDNEARLRNVADDVGITERAVQKIVGELQQAGFITIEKHGRCNRYGINTRKSLRHALEAECSIGRLLQLFTTEEKRRGKTTREKSSSADTKVAVQHKVTPTPNASPKPKAAQPAKPGAANSVKQKRAAVGGKSEDSKDPRLQGSLF